MLRKLLVGTDTSASADLAVEAAAHLAKANDAELIVLYVKPPIEAREVFDPKKAPNPQAYLASISQRFPGVRIRTREDDGDPAERINAVAAEEDVDAIVVGNRGTHERRRRDFMKSVPTAVVHNAPTSVYVVDTRKAQ